MREDIVKQKNSLDINHKINANPGNKQQNSPLKSTNRASIISSMNVQHDIPRRHSFQQDKLQIMGFSNNLASASKYSMKKDSSYSDNIQSCKIVLQLSQQVQTYKSMHSRSCDIIKQLQCKLRSVLSQGQLSEQSLRNQISMLKADINFINNQKQRNIQNIKIQSQRKYLESMQKKQGKYKKEKKLFEEEIQRQKHQIYEMNQEIMRLRQKNTKNKENQSININFLQKRNRQLKNQLQDLENKMKNQMNLRQQQLLKQFKEDLNTLHQQQTNEIRVLCKRVNSLKITLQDKQNQITQLWKARDLQANILFSKNHIRNSEIKQVNTTQTIQNIDPSVSKYSQQINQISLLDKYIR